MLMQFTTFFSFLMLQRTETKDDSFELTVSDSAKELLDSPPWWMAWNGFFETE